MNQRDLIIKTASLARRAPEEWSAFLGAFSEYADSTRDQCVSSPIDSVLIAQGRARECGSLLRLFTDCPKIADQMMEKK
jgi:hypothetical protein